MADATAKNRFQNLILHPKKLFKNIYLKKKKYFFGDAYLSK